MGKLERATIYILSADGSDKSKKDPPTTGIPVCFNPKEYQLDKSVTWDTEKAFADAPPPEFKQPTPMTLTVNLQFDTYEERVSVREKYVKHIEKLAIMRGKMDKNTKNKSTVSPPVVLFVWGRFTFQGVVNTLSSKYTMFLSDGTPVRAECALKLQQVHSRDLDDGKSTLSVKAGSSTKSYTVKQGDRLDLIAATELGDSSRWTEIAMLNGIQDPVTMDNMTTLQLPSD
jgi:nucleoid-associated protein YgaU